MTDTVIRLTVSMMDALDRVKNLGKLWFLKAEGGKYMYDNKTKVVALSGVSDFTEIAPAPVLGLLLICIVVLLACSNIKFFQR